MSSDSSDKEEDESLPFTERGKCFDEVRLVFDDKKELFVSQNVLMLSSPVFEAMFKNNFKEKQSMTVNLTGKTYEDFLEFLTCIHPGMFKSVTETSVLRITHIADEYQVASLIRRCKACLRSWLQRELKHAEECCYERLQVVHARNCLRILTVAHLYNYDELVTYSSSIVSKFGHRFYYGYYPPDTIPSSDYNQQQHNAGGWYFVKDIINESREYFKNLPSELRCKILSQRLARYSDNKLL